MSTATPTPPEDPKLSRIFRCVLSRLFPIVENFLPVFFGSRNVSSDLKQKYDAPTVAVLRQALNEVVTDQRFLSESLSRRLRWRSKWDLNRLKKLRI